MRQVAMDSYWHQRFEGRSSGQNGNINDENATAIGYSATRSATIVGGSNGAGGSHGRRDAGDVADLAIAVFHGYEDLLPDASLSCFVKIGEISSAEVFTLEVLLVTFLTVLFHSLEVTLSVLSYTRVILVGANNHMRTLSKLSPWVGATAAVARERAPAPAIAAWVGGRAVG